MERGLLGLPWIVPVAIDSDRGRNMPEEHRHLACDAHALPLSPGRGF